MVVKGVRSEEGADGVHFGEDDRQGDDDHEVRCGKYDKAPVRIAKDPQQPTEQDIKEHNVTHLPHRSWCPVCVKARTRRHAPTSAG